MRNTCVNLVHELARRDDRVVFIGSDLSPGLLAGMAEEFPSRWFMEGVSEQHIIGMAAGMALEGYMPYVNTIATFITRRCFEQVAVDVCLHDLPVRLIANGGGLVYAPLGPTHQAIEDIAILRALPNMTIVAPCDAEEMKRLMPETLAWPHPIYIRLAKGGDPIVSDAARGFAIGRAIHMCEAGSRGSPVLLVGTGITTTRCLQAADRLKEAGIESHVLHMHTVKPLDAETLVGLARTARLVVTVEEHTVIGGLGSAVLDCLVERLGARMPPIRRLGLPDSFVADYGSQDSLLEQYGLQGPQIAAAVTETLAGGMVSA